MRSRTLSTLPGRCARCWVRDQHCVCAAIPQVKTHAKIVITRHAREVHKTSGTARVAALALSNSDVVEFGEDPRPADEALKVYEGAWLVFPDDEGPRANVNERPSHLIVLDGTWRQTRRMLKKLPSLHQLPRLWLPEKADAPLRLRESPTAEGRSTLEAIADAVEMLEGPATAAPLHALHERFVEAVFKARGVWDLKVADFQSAVAARR